MYFQGSLISESEQLPQWDSVTHVPDSGFHVLEGGWVPMWASARNSHMCLFAFLFWVRGSKLLLHRVASTRLHRDLVCLCCIIYVRQIFLFLRNIHGKSTVLLGSYSQDPLADITIFYGGINGSISKTKPKLYAWKYYKRQFHAVGWKHVRAALDLVVFPSSTEAFVQLCESHSLWKVT